MSAAVLSSGLLGLLAWAYVVGMWQLSPPAEMVADPRLWTHLPLVGGLRQALAVVLLFWALRWRERQQGGALVAWLACAGWLGWADQGEGFWLAANPEQTQGQLLLSLTLVVGLVREGGPRRWSFGAPLVLAAWTSTVSWRWGLAAALTLLLAPGGAKQEPQEACLAREEKVLAAALALGFAGLGGVALGSIGLGPALLSLLLWWPDRPATRWLVATQWGLWLAGQSAQYPLWAAVGAALATPLHRLWRSPPDDGPPREPGEIFVPWPRLAALGVVALSWLLLKPGEEWLNRRVLLGAQKAGLAWHSLLTPQPLPWWVEHLGGRLEMGPDDLALADWLRGADPSRRVMVLTPGARSQSPAVQAILQELSGRRLWGWRDGELSPGARHALATGRYAGCGMDCVILRGPHQAREAGSLTRVLVAGGSGIYQISPVPAPVENVTIEAPAHLAPGALAPVSLPSLPQGELVAAQFGLSSPPWLVWTAAGPNYLPIPTTPGAYPLRPGPSAPPQRLVTVADPDPAHHLTLALETPATLPSRSLVQIPARLHNNGEQPLDLAIYRGIRLQASGTEAPIQPLPLQLEAHGQQSCPLYFATPELEGEGTAQVQLVPADGPPLTLSQFQFRTRRRLPAIGF